MSAMPPEYHKAKCPFCGQHVEVPDALANEWITCPNEDCGKSFPPDYIKDENASQRADAPPVATGTTPQFAAPKPASPAIANPKPADNSGERAGTVLLTIASVLLFLAGLGLVIEGCNGEMEESLKLEGSAIRQTVYAIQYGSGFIVLGLSIITRALARLISER
jgi:hypothetical protein